MNRLFPAALLVLAGALPATANDYLNQNTNDSFRYRNTYGVEVESRITQTVGNWSRYSQFAGLGQVWAYTYPNNDWVWIYNPPSMGLLPSLGAPVGYTRTADLGPFNNGQVTVAQSGATLATPVGAFSGVVRLDLTPSVPDAGVTSIWFAQGIGVVQWTESSIAGPVTYELIEATVNGTHYTSTPATPTPGPAGPNASFFPFQNFGINAQNTQDGEAVAAGDLNGDGRTDLAVSYWATSGAPEGLSVFLQDASGGFSATPDTYPLAGYGESIDIGDVNGDGRDDVVASEGTGIKVYLQTAAGVLQPQPAQVTPNGSRWVRVADLNADGRDDVITTNWGRDHVDVLFQDASGALSNVQSYPVTHHGYEDLQIGDVNGDGRLDVVISSGQGVSAETLAVVRQLPSGGLGPAEYFALPNNETVEGFSLGDVNGDGRTDIVATSYNDLFVFAQNAQGDLDPPSQHLLGAYSSNGPVVVADVNGDGRDDVVVASSTEVEIFHQTSQGALGTGQIEQAPYATWLNAHGMIVLDVNGDGFQDICTANYNYGLVIHYGRQPTTTTPTP